MYEQAKAAARRTRDGNFVSRYFVGDGLDIDGRKDSLARMADVFPMMRSCRNWSPEEGDLHTLTGLPNDSFDFVHACQCLARMDHVEEALRHWSRVLKPGGYLIIMVPDEDLYERGQWPSRFDASHRWTFTLHRSQKRHPARINVMDLVQEFSDRLDLERLCLIPEFFDAGLPRHLDQTKLPNVESGIEIIWKKKESLDSKFSQPYVHPSLSCETPGVWTRSGIPNNSESISQHYEDNAVQILKQDQEHYKKLKEKLQSADPNLMRGRIKTFAIGGGHPKFEAMFTVGQITVLDQFAQMYGSLHQEFISRYPCQSEVSYEVDRLDPDLVRIPSGVTSTFVHFLEHQTVAEIDKWLKAASDEVIIYGPSIESARTADWQHYRPEDHITFLTLGAMEEALRRAGFRVAASFHHDDDYYVRAVRS